MNKTGKSVWEPGLPNFPHIATPEVQKMADEVREQVEGFGIKGGSFSAMFYWAKSTKEGESYFIQIRLGPDVFTFVEVVKCKKSGRVELVKVQPSLRMEAPGGGGQTQKPVQVPIPSPDPCLLGLGPCP